MHKRKKQIIAACLAAMLTAGATAVPEAYAADRNVTVKLPEFPVALNGVSIENEWSRYPLIVYRDITYFPMTYFGCRFLGLESVWNAGSGLSVVKTGVNWGLQEYKADTPNRADYTAKTASFRIKVNGKSIDNSKEAYPLLIFRNVTYFPLTWRFAAEEFGWEYSYDKDRGLAIRSNSGGAAAGQITLPIVTREDGEKGAFTLAGNYFYYEGLKGAIYQTPVQSPSDKKKVYQLPEADSGARYVYASLRTENGRALLSYPTEGVAAAGMDHLIWLKEDGSSEEIKTGGKQAGGEQSSDSVTTGDMLYFTGSDGSLYREPIKGGQREKLADGSVGQFNVLNGKVYYSLKNKNNQLYLYGNEESVNPGGKLKSLENQNGYMVAIFDKASDSQYKMMIFDGGGNLIYKTIENVLLVRIENGKVVFVKDS
jgi:hypothetical protein